MFSWVWPYAFVLVLLPALIWLLTPRAKSLQGLALKVPFFQRLQQIQRVGFGNGLHGHFSWRYLLLILIWLLLVCALAGPQWLGAPITSAQQGRDLVLAIDLSGSMRTPDMIYDGEAMTRIAAVKKVAGDFIAKRAGDRLGLVLFGSRAYLQTPLTFDHKTVQLMLNDATIGLAGERTAIGDAIGLAVKRLMQYPKESRALILLTDGGDNASAVKPLAAAEVAKQQGIKIYTIGIGAESMTVQGVFGPQIVHPTSDLDIDGLKAIAKATGGQFFRAINANALDGIYAKINQLEPTLGDAQTIRPRTPLYPWPLGVAILLSLLLALSYCQCKRSKT